MSAVISSTVALRVGGDDLDPDEITQLLGTNPTHAHRKGDHISPKRPALRRSGIWLVSTEWEEGDKFEAQIQRVLSMLTDDLAVWQAISNRFEIDMYCGADVGETNPGFDLELSTLKMLVDRSIAFRLSIYIDRGRITDYLDQWPISDDHHPS